MKSLLLSFILSYLLSCQVSQKSDEISHVSGTVLTNGTQDYLKNFCATADKFLGSSYSKEIEMVCQKNIKDHEGQPISVTALINNAYTGQGSTRDSIKLIDLSSEGKRTNFSFIGATKISKSLLDLDKLRVNSLNISTFETEHSVEMSHKISRIDPPKSAKELECYLIKEEVKHKFGKSEDDLYECFYSPDASLLVSYQKYANPDLNSKKSTQSIYIRLQIAPSETVLLAVTSNTIDNKGFKSIAEKIIKEQSVLLMAKLFDVLSPALEAEFIPHAVSAMNVFDVNQIKIEEDWSFQRTKLSCKPNSPIFSIKQTEYSPIKPKALLQVGCGAPLSDEESSAAYRYEEAPNKILPKDAINCQNDEYAAGISYLRYTDSTHVIDGIKSLLCLKKKNLPTSCTTRDHTCKEGEYLRGIELKRVFGFICDTPNRLDDDGKGCYRADTVTCCQ